MTSARVAAIAAYDSACLAPVAADWRAVADLLRAAMPAARKALANSVRSAADAVPAWWQDYRPGKRFQAEPVEVTFADGRRVRLSMCSDPGKPANIGRAVRVACLFYRSKVHNAIGAPVPRAGTTLRGPADHVAVPAVAHVEAVDSGETWDAATCTRLTAEVRAGTWCEAEARAEAEAVAADPARSAAFLAPRRLTPWDWTDSDMVRAVMVALFCEAWRAAYGAAEDAALAANVALHGGPEAIEACRRKAEAEAACGDWTADPDLGARREPFGPEAVCEAVADSYGAPARAELSGTVEAAGPGIGGTDAAPAPRAAALAHPGVPCAPVRAPGALAAAPAPAPCPPAAEAGPDRAAPVAAAELARAVSVFAASEAVGKTDMGPVEAIARPLPVEAIGEARTVTAICASHKARRNLLRRVGDVPPVYGHSAKGGAFSLTLSEAAAAADVKCVRLIGLPRKPYTRAAALSPTPREAITTRHPHPAQSAPFLAALAGPMRPGYAACHSASFA